MITNFFGTWTTLFTAHPSEADSTVEVAVAVDAEAIAGQYRGTPMSLAPPKPAARSPKQLTYRGTPYTR